LVQPKIGANYKLSQINDFEASFNGNLGLFGTNVDSSQ